MSTTYRFLALITLVLTTVACGLMSQAAPATQTVIPPSDTPIFTATTAPSDTPAVTDTAQPSNTPAATETVSSIAALQTQLVATEYALMGPSAHLTGFLNLYSNPTGTPLESWHDIPIMKEATVGQEFQADIYSYKAPVTLQQATAFYAKQASTLNWSCIGPGSGSSGTGDQANHDSTFLCGPISIEIASFDKDPNQVLVVLNKAP